MEISYITTATQALERTQFLEYSQPSSCYQQCVFGNFLVPTVIVINNVSAFSTTRDVLGFLLSF